MSSGVSSGMTILALELSQKAKKEYEKTKPKKQKKQIQCLPYPGASPTLLQTTLACRSGHLDVIHSAWMLQTWAVLAGLGNP